MNQSKISHFHSYCGISLYYARGKEYTYDVSIIRVFDHEQPKYNVYFIDSINTTTGNHSQSFGFMDDFGNLVPGGLTGVPRLDAADREEFQRMMNLET